MQTAGTDLLVSVALKISFKIDPTPRKSDRMLFLRTGNGFAARRKSETAANPFAPPVNRCTRSSSPSAAKRFGKDINE
jgi:hypothetical protein